ncbi:MAG: peptidase M28, partial [Winogradskyella sp.]|nr:peptidase M28 [Winogradskyella sp.]
NFAFIDDHYDYHTALDRFDRLDRSSLKHQASYLMPLLSYFSTVDLSTLKSNKDKVYFNAPFFGIISYGFGLIIPLLIIAIILFVLLINKGLRNYKLSKTEIFRGFIPMLIVLLVNVLIGVVGWSLLKFIYPQYNEILHGFTYNGHLYIWAFSLLALGICFYTYHKFYKPRNAGSLLIAPLFLWLLLAIVLSFVLKGAAFFVIPVFFGLIILYLHTKQRQPNLYLLALLSFPLVMIMSPFIKMFPVGLGLKLLMASTLLVTLIFVLLIPVLAVYRRKKLWAILSFIASIVFFGFAHGRSGFNEDRPKPNSLVYLLDADDSTAVWATYDNLLDEWTTPFITEDALTAESLNNNGFASKYATSFSYYKKTDVLPINTPEISILSDTIIADKRYLRLYVLPKQDINRIEVFSEKSNEFIQFKVNSLVINTKQSDEGVFKSRANDRLFTYHVADEPYLDLEFVTPAYQNTSFTFYEASYDLLTNAKVSVPERAKHMIPKPFVLNDAVLVKKSITLKSSPPSISDINE